MNIFSHACARLLVAVAALASGWACAQSSAPSPHLQLSTAGRVVAVAVAPDGGTLLGGEFSTINGVARSNLARLAPDGTLDSNWHADTDFGVHCIAIGADGAVYVGGQFQHIGGVNRYNIAKLDALGHVDPSWDAHGSGAGVGALALDNAGNLFVGGGQFPSQIGFGYTNGLAKLSTLSGDSDLLWSPGGTYDTFVVDALQADDQGHVYAGGYFTNIGGQPRHNLAWLSVDGGGAADPDWTPVVAGAVYALQLDGAGHLFVGGDFDSAGGPARSGLAKLSTSGTGGVDPDWDPAGGGSVNTYTMALDGAGSLYIGGDFSFVSGVARANVAKLSVNGTGAVDASWNPGALGRVFSIAIGPGARTIAAGEFLEFGDVGRVGYGAISSSGTLLPAGNAGSKPGNATAIATQPDGGVVVGGNFDIANGIARRNLARVAPSGELDPQWNPGLHSQWPQGSDKYTVSAMAADADGSVFVGGKFTTIGGSVRAGMAKLAGTGAGLADTVWNPVEPDHPVTALALAVDQGSLLVGGVFSAIGGQTRSYLAKLDTQGSGAADSVWDPSPDNGISTLAVSPDHSLYAGGQFGHMGTTSRNHIAKLAVSGSGEVDASWNPGADMFVESIDVDSAGSVYAGGGFEQIGGLPLHGVAQLDGQGTGQADPAWTAPQSLNGYVYLVKVVDDDVYVGGVFNSFQGVACSNLVRLDKTTGVLDPDWLPALRNEDYEPNDATYALAKQRDNALYVGGNFTRIGEDERSGFARFTADPIFASGFD